MEAKHMVMSALGLGFGVGVGLGLAGSQAVGKWAAPMKAAGVTTEVIVEELMGLVVDGRECNVTFKDFPYYLSEQTQVVLTSAAFVHLKQTEFSKYTRNLSPASRAILLSGPTELYQQMLTKALAHYFESKLLLLDVSDFALKVQRKYGFANKDSAFKRSISESTLERVTSIFGSFSILPQEYSKGAYSGSLHRRTSGVDLRSRDLESSGNISKIRRNASASADMSSISSKSTSTYQAPPAPIKRTGNWTFDDKMLVQALYKVLVSVSKSNPVILYIRDVEGLVFRSQKMYYMFQKMLKSLSGSMLILGSKIIESDSDYGEVDEKLNILFPYNIEIKPPQDESHLVSWKSQLEEDMQMMQSQDNKNHIMEVLASNDLDCNDLGSVSLANAMVLGNYIEEIVVSAVSYHLMHNENPEYSDGKLVISSNSLSHVLNIFQENTIGDKDSLKLEANTDAAKEDNLESEPNKKPKTKSKGSTSEDKSETKKLSVPPPDGSGKSPKEPEVPPDNDFEKRIRPNVIPANEIGVTFNDIGALDAIKESLNELVMLPLRRPNLFKGGLLKPCRGILLFGPPGTGKTMLAKAIANEANASFINVSMSTITSKWFGEDEKKVRALFTLASKVSPAIIFVDEVDCMLGQRSGSGEHETMRKIKNEFMIHWDGLLTKSEKRILVLGATNRPFDLDEAIIRRFERRIMVGLPCVKSRELILKSLLWKENVEEELQYNELAVMTEGYSGSDLKNLCTAAAYRPLRELIEAEKQWGVQPAWTWDSSKISEYFENSCRDKRDMRPLDMEDLRPLNMEDLRRAKTQVSPSFAVGGSVMRELMEWNELYGEGGSRKKQQLTYFL